MSDTWAVYAAGAYREKVAHVAQRLRDSADRLERAGLDVQDHGGVMPSYAGDPYVHAAQRAVHEAMWGLANADLDGLVSAAGQADRAAREAGAP
jgi:hypothetical protein